MGMIGPDMVGSVLHQRLWVFDLNDQAAYFADAAREAAATVAGRLQIDFETDAPGRSDHLAFAKQEIPAVLVNSALRPGSGRKGMHKRFHTPQDTADSLNYEGLESVVHFLAVWTDRLAHERF